MRNPRARFMMANWVSSTNVSATSENASFPVTNLANDLLHKKFKPASMASTIRIVVNLGIPLTPGFIGLIGAGGESLSVSAGATVTVKADNLNNNWASAALSVSPEISDYGILRFLDDQTNRTYQYWAIEITDTHNDIIDLSYLYIGEYVTVTFSNVTRGFSRVVDDPSLVSQSESGVLYFAEKSKFNRFENLGIPFIQASERRELEQSFYDVGSTKPFFCSLDPTLEISDSLSELTRLVFSEVQPSFTHNKYDTFSLAGLALREVV